MILSKTCDYGLRAALYVASRESDNFISIREISKNLQISFHFLTKILQILTENNLMTSFRGPNGGVKLNRPASSISLLEIVLAIDGNDLFSDCLLGLQNCHDAHPCPLHENWVSLRAEIRNLLQQNTLKMISDKIKRQSLRISDGPVVMQ